MIQGGAAAGTRNGWRGTIRGLIVYDLVGCANTLLDLVIYTVLVMTAGVPPLVANVISFSSGSISSFLPNRRFTFLATHRRVTGAQIARFALVTAVCLSVSSFALFLLLFALTPLPAKLGSVIASFLVGYALQRFFVFGTDKDAQNSGQMPAY